MTLSSSSPNPVRPIRSTVDLTCIVHMGFLGPKVDVPMILTTILRVPGGFLTTIDIQSQPTNWGRYTSRAMISSFGREQSGIYTCMATLSSSSANSYLINSSTSNSIHVTTGET